MMRTIQGWKEALQSLLANKLRSGLTMLGIIIGVGAVIALVAAGAGAQAQVRERFESLGANMLVISPRGGSYRGVGQAASMGAVLLAAGAAGKRKALPNSRIMIHQPLAGAEGTAEDILIHAKEFMKVKERLNRILIKHTGHPLEKIEQDTDRDRFMSAEEALEYGLIDHVIEHAGQA